MPPTTARPAAPKAATVDPSTKLEALLAELRTHDRDRLSADALLGYLTRLMVVGEEIGGLAQSLTASWGAQLLDASADDARAHDERLRVLEHDGRRATVLVAELQTRLATAQDRERQSRDNAVIETLRAGRLNARAIERSLEKTLKALGAGLRELTTLHEQDHDRLADLTRAGYTTSQIIGDDPEAQLAPGALECYRGALLFELVPLVPSATGPTPYFGAEHGESATQREARLARERERDAESCEIERRKEEERERKRQHIEFGTSAPIRGGGFFTRPAVDESEA